MIKEWGQFKINTDYLIGLPSGQIIDIYYKEINNIKQEGLISYHNNLMSYVFKDEDYEKVMRYLKRKIKEPEKDVSISYSDDYMNKLTMFFDEQKRVRTYMLTSTGVEVSGDIYVSNSILKRIPMKFKRVSGDFIWKDSKLETLDGAPDEVGGSFIVSNNNLSDLTGGPKYVGTLYDCSVNVLLSLEGSPDIIRSDFNCSDNLLITLKGGPKKVKGYFDCSLNQLKSMDGAPDCLHIMGGKGGKVDPVIAMQNALKKNKIKTFGTYDLRDEGDGSWSW